MWAIASTYSRYSCIRCHTSSISFCYILWGGNVNQLFSFNPIEGNYVPHDNAQENEERETNFDSVLFSITSMFVC